MQFIKNATGQRPSRRVGRRKRAFLMVCMAAAKGLGALFAIADKAIDLWIKLRDLL